MLRFLLVFFTGKRVVVRDWSMSPTLVPDEYVLVDRLAYRRREPQRGDIVLARHPDRPEMLLIKRLAGVPGDRVQWDAAGVCVNGARRSEEGTAGPRMAEPREQLLDAGAYFLVGDNLGLSVDSRHFGPVARRAIVGKARLVYWPSRSYRRVD